MLYNLIYLINRKKNKLKIDFQITQPQKQSYMQNLKSYTLTTPTDTLQLLPLTNKINQSYYFQSYSTNRSHSICLIKTQNKVFKSLSNINTADEYFCSLGYKKYDQIYNTSFDNNQTLVLLYNGLTNIQNLSNLKGKLNKNQILDLCIFLLKIVLQSKLNNIYFGSFLPNRIFMMENEEFCIIGGQNCMKEEKVWNYFNNLSGYKEIIHEQWKYQAPQIYQKQADQFSLNYLSDMFVIGCIIYQALTNQYPFPTLKSLLTKQKPNPSTNPYPQLTKQLINKIFLPMKSQRIQPQQLLHMLQLERGKTIFNTCQLKYPLNTINQPTLAKSNIFDNFHQFIMKCTTQTQGWFLYYCQNCQEAPNQRYLEQIIQKILKNKQKLQKIFGLTQKCCQKQLKQQNITPPFQDNTFSILKTSIITFHFLRKLPSQLITPYDKTILTISKTLISKKIQNKIITIMYKIIAFKISLYNKFAILYGNFFINIDGFLKVNEQYWEYLAQYVIKILGYLSKLGEQIAYDNLKQCENVAIICICDQIYDAISTLFYILISIKKDITLKLPLHFQFTQQTFKKFDKLSSQIIQNVSKLCTKYSIFGCHHLYSINSDYYYYQQQLCLLYEPIVTSYQYFYWDKKEYKGLKLPKDYGKIYCLKQKEKEKGKQFGEEFGDEQDSRYKNRKPMMNRLSSLKPVEVELKPKINTNSQKISFDAIGETKNQLSNMKSQGFNPSHLSKPSPNPPSVKIQISQTQQKNSQSFLQFQHFTSTNPKSSQIPSTSLFNLFPPPESTLPTNNSSTSNPTIQSSKNNQSNPTCQSSWFQPQQHDIFSYEWLIKSNKQIIKHFEKPQLDPIIYVVYEDICKGLKLHELVDTLQKNKKVIVDPNQVLFQKVIGSGSAGQVYIGKYRQNVVAIKKVKIISNPNALKQFQREVLTYIKIKTHPCLVSMVGLTKYGQDYFLLTQFCQGGSLFDLLHKKVNEIPLNWSQRLSIAIDIAKGMQFLHFMNPPVIHRDLKSLNVFMTKRNNMWAGKIADFGLSRSPDAGMMTSALGTLHWMAPQLLSNKQYSVKVDVYSFGIVLWQICSRRTPYHNLPNQMAIVKYVALQKGRPLLDLINAECPKQLINLMIKCWHQQPEQRPYFPQIIAQLKKIRI